MNANVMLLFPQKFFKLLIGLTHCSIALLCAGTSILHVSANETIVEYDKIPTIALKTITSTPLPPQNNYEYFLTRELLQLWSTVSEIQVKLIHVVSIISIIVLLHALFLMVTRYRRSNYFDFMTTMIVLDLLMLTTIIFNLTINESLTSFKGSMVCKVTSFVTNAARCFINWAWVNFVEKIFLKPLF